MSQFPNPYSSPQFPGGMPLPQGNPSLQGLPRKAAAMLFVIGGLSLLVGACAGMVIVAIPAEQFHALAEAQSAQTNAAAIPAGFTFEQWMKLAIRLVAATALLVGFISIILGIFVWRASKAATILSIIFSGLALLVLGYQIIGGLVLGLGNPQMLLGVCMMLIPSILFILATRWLSQLLKALPHIAAARAQWQNSLANSQQRTQYQQGALAPGQWQPPVAPGPAPGMPSIGYGAFPVIPQKPEQSAPPSRHPPLPPDQNAQWRCAR